MSDNPLGPTDPPRREWPEPPPFRPELDKIMFIEEGRYLDPKPSWWAMFKSAFGFRAYPKKPS